MTQTELIRNHLESGLSITPLEALTAYGCFRLGARIWELKQDGMAISREMVTDPKSGKHYARYRAV